MGDLLRLSPSTSILTYEFSCQVSFLLVLRIAVNDRKSLWLYIQKPLRALSRLVSIHLVQRIAIEIS